MRLLLSNYTNNHSNLLSILSEAYCAGMIPEIQGITEIVYSRALGGLGIEEWGQMSGKTVRCFPDKIYPHPRCEIDIEQLRDMALYSDVFVGVSLKGSITEALAEEMRQLGKPVFLQPVKEA